MGLKRRAFLQHSALIFAGLGASQVGLSTLGMEYQQALAQSTRRKLALLIGINHYPESVSDRAPAGGSLLTGCLTDVQLQQELLVSRFGFQAADVLTLTNEQATRSAIEEAVLNHLGQARSGDVVVLHLSGLGSRVKVIDALDPTQVVECNSFVPVDGVLPTEEHPEINDLLEETLFLLLRSLQTDQIVTVLDIGYGEPVDQIRGGALRLRSRPITPTGTLSVEALQRQEALLNQVKLLRKSINPQSLTTQMPGLVLSAAEPGQVVVEGQWQGFSAGLFTYALTQQLWRSTPDTTFKSTLSRVAGMVSQVMGDRQQPQLAGLKASESGLLPYYLTPLLAMGADGMVRSVDAEGNNLKVWLAGLPAPLLGSYGVGSLLKAELPPAETSESSSLAQDLVVQVRSQDGLLLKVRPSGQDAGASVKRLKPGQPVREYVRVLPRHMGLTVALDDSLERVERVDATSAFATIPGVSSIVAGEQPADCLFGKVNLPVSSLTAALPSQSEAIADTPALPSPSNSQGYGLFYLGKAVMPNTMTEDEEAVKTAVNRLAPKLHTLLSTKLLRLTENAGSSRLGVRAVLEMVSPQERILAKQETSRAPWTVPAGRLAELFTSTGEIPVLKMGSHIQFRLQNYSDRPVYFLLLGLNTIGGAIAFYPSAALLDNSSANFQQVLNTSVIPPGDSVTLPQSNLAPDWVVQGPPGIAETYLIFSHRPLTQSYTVLADVIRATSGSRRASQLSQPLAVAQAVLEDLHQASQPLRAGVEIPDDSFALDVNAWATFNFVYRVASPV